MNVPSPTPQGFSPRPGVYVNTFSFRDVLQAKKSLGHITHLHRLACSLGFEYMLWDDRVYFLQNDSYFDTGLTRAAVC